MNSSTRHLAAALLLTVSVALAYARAFENSFVYDDNFQIVRNPFLHADQPWYRLFTSDVWGYTRPGERGLSNYYRPLQMLTYRTTAQLGGLKAGNFHAVNLAFHLLATLVAYGVLWQLSRRAGLALGGGVLFALHPMHSEAVVWISALTELGCALFFFLSFYFFILAEDDSRGAPGRQKGGWLAWRNRAWRAGSWACFLLALLWKEMALTLPFVVAAYAAFLPPKPRPVVARVRAAVQVTLPYWGVLAAYLVLRYHALGFFSRVQQAWVLTPGEYLLSVVNLMAKYGLKLLLPVNLNSFHVFNPVRSVAEPRALASIAFVVLAGALIAYGLRRGPLASFAVAWVFLTLLPVLNLRGVGMNVFAERYLYIPSLGFCLLAVWLADKSLVQLAAPRRPWAGRAILALVSALYLFQTVRRIPDWKDDFTLYSRTVEASPNSALMHNSLAQILRDEKGDLEGAERHYLLAIGAAMERRPAERRQIANAYVGLAGIYTARHQYQKALEAVEHGMGVDNSFSEIHVARGVVLMHLGRLQEAEKILREVNEAFPNDEVVLNALGVIALSQKDYELAIAWFQRALQVLPNASGVHNNLGRAYGELGRYGEALPHFQRAVELAPNDPMFHTNLGVLLGRMGRLAEARAELERALALAPDYQPARANLAALAQLERQRR